MGIVCDCSRSSSRSMAPGFAFGEPGLLPKRRVDCVLCCKTLLLLIWLIVENEDRVDEKVERVGVKLLEE